MNLLQKVKKVINLKKRMYKTFPTKWNISMIFCIQEINLKKKQMNPMRINIPIFILFMVIMISPIWSDETMDNKTLESILIGKNTTIEMYSIPFSVLSQFPIYENTMRDAFRSKIIIKNQAIRYIKELILSANSFPSDREMNIRLLIDILVDEEIIYTIPINGDEEGIINEVRETFRLLFGLRL